MAIVFYPHEDSLKASTLPEKLEVLMESADQYKAAVLDVGVAVEHAERKRQVPRDLSAAYNWEEIASVLRDIRELPEATAASKTQKADYLNKLAEIYEVLRGAKMPKLEAVRIALVSEANQLRGSASQVA